MINLKPKPSENGSRNEALKGFLPATGVFSKPSHSSLANNKRSSMVKAETSWVFEHFAKYFSAKMAVSETELHAAHKIRHDVFCDETKIFEGNSTGLERDLYDNYAQQLLIQHQRTHDYAGSVRLIMPQHSEQLLPIERYGSEYITDKSYLPSRFDRNSIVEVSRILVPKAFRKRRQDSVACAEQTGIDISKYNENDRRCFPYIAVGLYMACTAMCDNRNKRHIFFMADPRLGRSMQVVGLTMRQIGPEFNYVGRRVPYYIDLDEFLVKLKPNLRSMLDEFLKSLK